RNDRAQRAGSLLEELGLSSLRERRAETLSGGERRRLEIARALALEPAVILLDEPFAGVDPIAVADVQGIVRGLRAKGIGVLLTDHNVRETLAITDRSYIIDAGRIIAEGPPRAIVEHPEVRRTYLGEGFKMPELTG
ncbi:MAG: ATP-binding cassette domain-containing protein, partial [Planctomycetales bacterium]|nr:ATP-binding cassette domain-containing protein [Planctomycetales bacterium]